MTQLKQMLNRERQTSAHRNSFPVHWQHGRRQKGATEVEADKDIIISKMKGQRGKMQRNNLMLSD